PVAAEPPGNLADAQAHLHHAAQAASLLEAEVAVSLSHGDPKHSRCRTWFVSLRRAICCAKQLPAVPICQCCPIFHFFLYMSGTFRGLTSDKPDFQKALFSKSE